MRNAFDAVRPFVEALNDDHRVQLVGGVGSFVLQHEGVEILFDEKLVVAPLDMDPSRLGLLRPDGTRRDLDVLVVSADQGEIDAIEELARQTVDGLDISAFGLHPMDQLQEQRDHPVRSMAKVWVGDRYVTEGDDGAVIEASKALFPFAADMDPETLETWQLVIGDDKPAPIPPPGTTILNYLTRSVSGLRPKDADKVDLLARHVLRDPHIVDWIIDGPGQSQLELARILHTLREPSEAKTLTVGSKLDIVPYDLAELADHPMMLIDSCRMAVAAVRASRLKSRGLHAVERQAGLVTAYQRHVERHLGAIIKNS